MKSCGLIRSKSLLSCAKSLLIGVAILAAAMAAPAQTACPPSGSTKGDGADLQCRMGNLLNKQGEMVVTMQNKAKNCNGSQCAVLQDRLARAAKQNQRALNAHGRSSSDDYQEWTHKRGKHSKPGKSDDAYTDGGYDTAGGVDIADNIDDATTAVQQVNESLNTSSNSIARYRPKHPRLKLDPVLLASRGVYFAPLPSAAFDEGSGSVGLYDFEADPEYPAWLHTNEDSTHTRYNIHVAALALKAVESTAKDGCQQDIFGENTSAVCMVFSAATGTMEAIDGINEFDHQDSILWEAHGAYKRAEQVFNSVQGVSATVGNVDAGVETVIQNLNSDYTDLKSRLVALKSELDQTRQEIKTNRALNMAIIRLLLTPDGKKNIPASLLNCTGDGCPMILTCNATSCSFPLQ